MNLVEGYRAIQLVLYYLYLWTFNPFFQLHMKNWNLPLKLKLRAFEIIATMAQEITNSKRLTFAHSFKPIYIWSRLFGFMPFTIVFDSDGAIRTAQMRVIDILWLIVSIGIYLLSASHFIIYTGRKPVISATLTQGARSIVVFRKLFNCLCIGIDMCNRVKLVDILKKINTFDEKVS